MKKIDRLYKRSLSSDWKIDNLIEALNKHFIEISLDLDNTTKTNALSFNIRFREKDKKAVHELLDKFL